jgi:predicted RNA binding protein YcfA (HicA-like mRNA interferase family)
LKRRDLIRHLEDHGCELLREGGNHTIFVNRATKKTSSHRDRARHGS